MRAVQRRPASRWSTLGPALLTVLAVVLILLALTVPNRLEDVEPGAFVRLPVEAIVYLALVLALPPRFVGTRRVLAVVAGVVLGLTAVFTVLDIGFMAALNRPFDALIDWRYAGSLVETVRGSAEGALGIVLLVLAGLLILALLVLLPLSVLRVTRVVSRHRAPAIRVVAVLASLWLVFSLLDLRTETGSVASRKSAAYVYGQVSRIPSELRDQDEFARAAQTDPMRNVPAGNLLTDLRGKDVLLVFVESYGRVAAGRLELRAGRQRGPPLRHPAAGAVRLRQPQRLPHLTHLRCRQLARALDTPVGPVGRQPAALRPARDQSAPDPEQHLRTGGVADGGRHPGQHRATGRRVPSTTSTTSTTRATSATRARGSATRRCRTSTPWTRSTASSSRRPAGVP